MWSGRLRWSRPHPWTSLHYSPHTVGPESPGGLHRLAISTCTWSKRASPERLALGQVQEGLREGTLTRLADPSVPSQVCAGPASLLSWLKTLLPEAEGREEWLKEASL